MTYRRRHPLPDSYQLTLEVLRDRATTATQRTCGPHQPCPAGYSVGDTYINRTLNRACAQQVSFRRAAWRGREAYATIAVLSTNSFCKGFLL